jgi:hypothetical protein
MTREGGPEVFLKALVVALLLNVAAHAVLSVWARYAVAVMASLAVAAGVWIGTRIRSEHASRH